MRVFLVLALASCGPADRTADDPSSCTAGTTRCNGDYAETCRDDGTWQRTFCDPVQGMTCEAEISARCAGSCTPDSLGRTYIGCEYFPTITGNVVGHVFHFAIAVANTATEPATVAVEWGSLSGTDEFVVPAGQVVTRSLPWVDELKGCTLDNTLACSTSAAPARATYVPKGAFHVRSTRPVTIYQFNPVEYALGADFSYSNDASLLFPANALARDYIVAGWPSGTATQPGFVAITAIADDTHVTITSPTDIEVGHRTPAITRDMPAELVLDRSDAIELYPHHGDLTGMRITADAPIQVIAGHVCTNVPAMTPYCDHLEDAMLPIDALGAEYLVAAPIMPALPHGKTRVIRIVAAEPDTFLMLEPALSVQTYLAHAGDFVEIPDTTAMLHVRANRKILVAQYMTGQEAGGNMGDPAMVIAVPVEQFRTDYLFHAPPSYDLNYAEVIAPTGAIVKLDGALLEGFEATPDPTRMIARVALGIGIAGNHRITASAPVGVSVYGYGQYTSYWYPGGLDLEPIVLQ